MVSVARIGKEEIEPIRCERGGHLRKFALYATGIVGTVTTVPSKILLVIPCYKERERLPRFLPRLVETLTRSQIPIQVLVVDDGSGDEHQAWLKLYVGDLSRRFPDLLPPICNPENVGKGGAVYTGWRTAGMTIDWLAFVDADGAVAPEEVVRLLRRLPDQPDQALWAVRTGGEQTTVRRVFKRKISGLGFRTLVKKLFHFPVPDTQCGFKIVPTAAFQKIESNLEETAFCFDVELTYRLLEAGVPIQAVPINWEESPGTRLGMHSVWAMLRSVVRLRRRLGQ
jgi:dolichyl-phosphate beta-glucosyltransferase